MALKAGEVKLIQCRYNGYISAKERANFIEVAGELRVMPVLAFRESRKLMLEELGEVAAKKQEGV